MTADTGDLELMRRLSRGEYVVDPRAVADAMVEWWAYAVQVKRLREMVETTQSKPLSLSAD